MNPSKSINKNSSKPICDAEDGRIACYHRDNYKFRGLKARSLAWFVQIAIRRDMRACYQGVLQRHDLRILIQGHLEIFNKLNDLETLIRQHHIVDEECLATIGLTLYNFPTLSHFFVAIKKQAFVREATVQELIDETNYIRDIVLNSRLAAFIPGEENCPEADDGAGLGLVNQMTLAKVEKEAGLEGKDVRKEKFLLVDMAAPVMILKHQFGKLLDREAKLKQSPYDDWEEYGILPYLDLQQWEKNIKTKVKPKTRAELIYSNRQHAYDPDPKKIAETTRPHIEKLMDEEGPVFRSLLADASAEFWGAIAWAREECTEENAEMAEEALTRWFPRTFPFNLSDLERAARMFPKSRDGIQQTIEFLRNGRLNLSVTERVRLMSEEDGTPMLCTTEALGGKNAYPFSVPPEAVDFHSDGDAEFLLDPYSDSEPGDGEVCGIVSKEDLEWI